MFEIIEKQQRDIDIPTYSDKRITDIPIQDIDEEMVDVFDVKDNLVDMLPTPTVPFSEPTFNAGFSCSSFIRKSLHERLKALSYNMKRLSNRDFTVFVYEGLRTLDIQEKLFNTCVEELKEEFPDLSKTEIIKLAEKNISHPNNNPPHSTGGAVDIRVWDVEKSEYVDMGTFGNYWGKNPQAFTFCIGLTDEQKKNRHLLLTAAAMSGLVNYPCEWWHFSYGDQYFCYWTGNKKAIYKNL